VITGEILVAVGDTGAAERVPEISLAEANLLERQHLQEWVVAHPQILGPDVLVIAVEYDGWVVDGGAQRDRLDVLGLDRAGRLVVAELKRGIAPDTVEMQAIKYAAMASRFDLESLAAAYAQFRARRGSEITIDQAVEALQAHADEVTEETIADPQIVVIAQGFSPVVVSSVVWLADRGVRISLVRFQAYRTVDGQVLATFSRLFPLPDLEKSIVSPGAAVTEVPTDKLPVVEWTTAELVQLGRVANATTRTALDLCAETPGEFVSLTQIVDAAGVTRPAARGQLAGLTMVMKRRFHRRNWPFKVAWAVDGTEQMSYSMNEPTALLWLEAAKQLDVEQSDEVVA
jgi:hypothetical protein